LPRLISICIPGNFILKVEFGLLGEIKNLANCGWVWFILTFCPIGVVVVVVVPCYNLTIVLTAILKFIGARLECELVNNMLDFFEKGLNS
jgi:hypothetical protein